MKLRRGVLPWSVMKFSLGMQSTMGWLCVLLSHLLVSGHVFEEKYSNAKVRFKSTLSTSNDILPEQGNGWLSSLPTVFLLHLWNPLSCSLSVICCICYCCSLDVIFVIFARMSRNAHDDEKWQSDKILASIWRNVAILANLYIFYDESLWFYGHI